MGDSIFKDLSLQVARENFQQQFPRHFENRFVIVFTLALRFCFPVYSRSIYSLTHYI